TPITFTLSLHDALPISVHGSIRRDGGLMAASASQDATYTAMSAQVDLPALEHEILAFWREHDVFGQAMDASAGRPEWTFYEGPRSEEHTSELQSRFELV